MDDAPVRNIDAVAAWAEQVNLKVLIYQRPHLRDEGLEYELMMGTEVLRRLFDVETNVELPNVTELYLPFPERWLNIVEERSLFQRLARWCPNLKKVTIKTQSVYIIQSTPNGHAFIVTVEMPLPKESVSGILWRPMTGNFFGDGHGLTVLGSSGVKRVT